MKMLADTDNYFWRPINIFFSEHDCKNKKANTYSEQLYFKTLTSEKKVISELY